VKVISIVDVTERHLCTGCGACAFVQPDVLTMVDVLDQGRRPVLQPGRTAAESAPSLAICPGASLSHDKAPPDAIASLLGEWGPVLEVWEGYAADPEVRYRGSSGGVATALAIDSIEHQGMHGVLHITARPDAPILNHTVLSTTRDELAAAAGSRYAPASPCDSLDLVEAAPGPCVFIGKPCDVAAVQKVRAGRPGLDANLGLTIGIFCAGTPTLKGTLKMLEHMGVTDSASVEELRYRGNGWPGEAVAVVDGDEKSHRLSYAESWGDILQEHRQWRCYVCADHTGEFADVSVGDPWYRPVTEGEAGRSLVVVRTERGRQAVRAAMTSGSVVLERVDPELLPASQPNLLETRGAIWGRMVGLRLMGVPHPRYRNMATFPTWRRLPMKKRAQSIYGTVKRVFVKRLRQKASTTPMDLSAFLVEGSTEPLRRTS
jgi:coenzyme F420 hydrogenase subunit beta